MAPPTPYFRSQGPEKCPHDERIDQVCTDVREIKDGLLGCIETGEPGALARLMNVETELAAMKAAQKERDEKRTAKQLAWHAAIVSAIVSAVSALGVALWSAFAGKAPP